MIDRAIKFLLRAEDKVASMGPEAPDPNVLGMPPEETYVAESESPIDQDEAAAALRNAVAASLVDPDTYGYLLFTLKKPNPAGASGEVDVAGYIQPEWWPAFIDMCLNSAEAGKERLRNH